MDNINKSVRTTKKELVKTLRQNFLLALEDQKFVKLVNRLKVDEETLIKYTSKLETTVEELDHCKGCKGLSYCKNRVSGYVSYPEENETNDGLIFSYRPCKFEKDRVKEETKTEFFDTPKFLREAKMSDIYMDDKSRIGIIKYITDFIKKYDTKDTQKGLYLYGSFGSGKSYIVSALINELSKKGYRGVNVYFPTMLKSLKEGFNDNNYDSKFNEIMTSDILLIDDIGAENNTAWSRDEVLGTILQYRMDNELATFLTSNFNLVELEEHLATTSSSSDKIKARRIIERIKQLTNQIELVGENRRQ